MTQITITDWHFMLLAVFLIADIVIGMLNLIARIDRAARVKRANELLAKASAKKNLSKRIGKNVR